MRVRSQFYDDTLHLGFSFDKWMELALQIITRGDFARKAKLNQAYISIVGHSCPGTLFRSIYALRSAVQSRHETRRKHPLNALAVLSVF